MLPLHGWLGLITAAVIYLVAFTGALCVFGGEIDSWARPAKRFTNAAPINVHALQRMIQQTDGDKDWVVLLPSSHRDVGRATILGAAGKRVLFFNPSNGELIKTSIGPTAFLLALHSRLTVRIWNIGYVLVTASGLALLALVLTGLFLYPRLIADLFTLRIGPPLATLATIHRLTGIFGLPFNLIVVLGGLLMLVPILAERPISALYRDQPVSFERELGAACPAPSVLPPTRNIALASIVRQAEVVFSGRKPGRLTYDAGVGTLAVEPTRERSVSFERDRLCFDAGTGKLLQATQAGGSLQHVEQLLTGIHLAQYDRLAIRLAHFLSGILLCGLIASGLLLWSENRRRTKPAKPVELVERWTIGLTLGLPVATLLYFCADRFVLDSALAGQITFWASWAGCMLIAVLVGRRSCRPLLILTSSFAGVAALVDHTTTSNQIIPTGVNIALFAIATACAALAAAFCRPAHRTVTA